MVISEIRWSLPSRVLLYGGLALHFVFVMVTAGRRIGLALLVFYLAMIAFLMLVQTLRVRMEGMDLLVGFTIFNKRIPLHDIDRVAPIHYGFFQWAGWGVRHRRGAVMYNVPGDKGRAVELTLRSGKRVLFSAEDPEAVASAIRVQRAMVP
jgi:hypothetical protein